MAAIAIAPTTQVTTTSHQEAPSPDLAGRIWGAVSGFFNHPVVTGMSMLASTAGIIASSFMLFHANDAYDECFSRPDEHPWLRHNCDKELSNIRELQIPLAISCGVIGITIQKFLSVRSKSISEATSLLNSESEPNTLSSKVKRIAFYLQSHHFLEAQLGVGYLYAGLWFNWTEPSSYLIPTNVIRCETSGVALAAALLGMYIRIQLKNIHELYLEHIRESCPTNLGPGYLRLHKKGICIKIPLAITIVALSNTAWTRDTQDLDLFVLAPVLVMVGRLVRQISADWVDRGRHTSSTSLKTRVCTIITTGLHWQTPLVIIGYLSFFTGFSDQNNPVLWGTGLVSIGTAGGLQKRLFKPKSYQAITSSYTEGKSVVAKIILFIENHWKTICLASFLALSESLQLLRCTSEYACPIYMSEAKDLTVALDSRGVNISIIAGMATYYARKILRTFQTYSTEGKQHPSKKVLHWLDKHQFDLVSALPCSLLIDSNLINIFDLSYNNPPLFTSLLGIVSATIKEQIDAADKSAVGQFSNPSIVAGRVLLT